MNFIFFIFIIVLQISGVRSTVSVKGFFGGNVVISCKYDVYNKDNAKYFCRGQSPGCVDLIKTNLKNQLVHSGRFSLLDNTHTGVFTVTITHLTSEDAGTYQCATDRYLLRDLYTPVVLSIGVPKAEEHIIQFTTTQLVPASSQPLDGRSSSLQDSHDWSPIIALSVIVLVLIVAGLLILMVIINKRRKTQDPAPAVSEDLVHEYGNSEWNIVRRHSAHECCPAGLSTIPSSFSTLYDTPKLPTIHSESSIAVYENSNISSYPSDYFNNVYETPILPVIVSEYSNTVNHLPKYHQHE